MSLYNICCQISPCYRPVAQSAERGVGSQQEARCQVEVISAVPVAGLYLQRNSATQSNTCKTHMHIL